MNKILPNRPSKIIIDSPDYFDSANKARGIKYFLENAKDGLNGNNMIVLYGGWGSGKSTLMEHIKAELDKGKLYKTVFFTAWEHEKDDNLALSLVDAITSELKRGEAVSAFVKESAAFFVNIFRGLTLKTPDFLGFGLQYDFDKQQKAINEYYEKAAIEGSFFRKIKGFKESFQKMEDEILEENQKLIVFIDDLDRCEPENILILLSSIKLFFSLGKRTVFFFGVDKDAVTNAVKTKYRDIIKSEEYLEKVFDISFSMPKNTSIYSLISYYFPNHAIEIVNFFTSIDFTIPRHLKKVLNKYMVVRTLKDNIMGYEWKDLIPNILDEKGRGDIMETIFTLFIIILYEYYYEMFIELEDYEGKVIEYARIYKNTLNNANVRDLRTAFEAITNDPNGCCFKDLKDIMVSKIVDMSKDLKANPQNIADPSVHKRFIKFLSIFTPKRTTRIDLQTAGSGANENDFIKQFDDSTCKILINFCYFLLQNKEKILKMQSTYRFSNIFLMARTIL